MLGGKLSHDKITRFLSKGNYDSKYLWQQVKPMVQELSSSEEEIVLSFDDSIEEKYYSDPSELICWHYDHVFNRSVKALKRRMKYIGKCFLGAIQIFGLIM